MFNSNQKRMIRGLIPLIIQSSIIFRRLYKMKHEYLIQCKRIIISGKKSNKFIKLTLADKLHLMRLSRRLKKEGNVDSMSFEEFTLLCKHHKKAAMLRV